MHHIIYMSRIAQPLTEGQLGELLKHARHSNKQKNITGALIYGADQFMQIIEGDEATVAMLYAQILADPRHKQVVKLADKQILQRSFDNWEMAFQTVSPAQFEDLEGYKTPEQINLHGTGLSAADDLLLQMMKSFVFVSSN